MGKEDAFSKRVYSLLRSLLKDEDLEIAERKHILSDVTGIYDKGTFKLLHSFSETDIVIYKEVAFEREQSSDSIIKFYGSKEVKEGRFAIPYVVIELKTGDLTSDGIRSRSIVASGIRSIFPLSAYYLIAEKTKKENQTLLKQGKSFTNYFISKDSITDKEIKSIFDNYIAPYIKNLKQQLKEME